MEQTPVTWFVTNSASGSFSEEAVEQLAKAFVRARHPLQRILRIPDDAAPTPAALEAAAVGLLAIFTGDGTVNAVVTGLYGWGGKVLVLPGGTQNLMAKALHGESSAEDILQALAGGGLHPARRNRIGTSQGDALCEVLAGPGARWSDVREAMREGDLGEMASTLREAIGQSAGGTPVRVVEPDLGKPEGYPAVRLHLDGGGMSIDGYAAGTLGEYAQQGVALLRRDFRDGPHDELGDHRAAVCRSDEPIELMIDGERRTGAREERFELRECPVEFLALSGQPPAP